MEHEHEEVEQIPWAMLADQLEGGRRRSLGMLAFAVAGAVIVAVVALNVLRRPSGTTVEIVPGTTEVAAAAAAPTLPEPAADFCLPPCVAPIGRRIPCERAPPDTDRLAGLS